MKWFYMILVVMFVGGGAYYWFYEKDANLDGTARGTAVYFVRAACEGDIDGAVSYCSSEAEEMGRNTAQKLNESGVTPAAVSLKPTESSDGTTAFTSLVNGDLMTLKLSDADGYWVIVVADL